MARNITMRQALNEALDRLPTLTREILVLYYREDNSVRQVAMHHGQRHRRHGLPGNAAQPGWRHCRRTQPRRPQQAQQRVNGHRLDDRVAREFGVALPLHAERPKIGTEMIGAGLWHFIAVAPSQFMDGSCLNFALRFVVEQREI